MSRVINPNAAGKQRTRLTKAIVAAIRELMQQSEVNARSRDLAAFIALSLEEIARGVDVSASAWEKRGYWVKADRFRMEWEWAGQTAASLREALLRDDWAQVAALTARVAEKLSHVKVSPRHRMGQPWLGAWEELRG